MSSEMFKRLGEYPFTTNMWRRYGMNRVYREMDLREMPEYDTDTWLAQNCRTRNNEPTQYDKDLGRFFAVWLGESHVEHIRPSLTLPRLCLFCDHASSMSAHLLSAGGFYLPPMHICTNCAVRMQNHPPDSLMPEVRYRRERRWIDEVSGFIHDSPMLELTLNVRRFGRVTVLKKVHVAEDGLRSGRVYFSPSTVDSKRSLTFDLPNKRGALVKRARDSFVARGQK